MHTYVATFVCDVCIMFQRPKQGGISKNIYFRPRPQVGTTRESLLFRMNPQSTPEILDNKGFWVQDLEETLWPKPVS